MATKPAKPFVFSPAGVAPAQFTPAPVQAAPKAPKEKKPTKADLKAQAEAAEREQDAWDEQSINAFYDNLTNQPFWQQASLERRQFLLKNYEENVYPEYARQRFGDSDTADANIYKSRLLSRIKQDLATQQQEINSWANKGLGIGRSVVSAASDLGSELLTLTPYVYHALTGNNDAALKDLEKLRQEMLAQMEGEREARAANPWLENEARRNAEIEEAEFDTPTALYRLWNEGNISSLANMLAQQIPAIGTITAAGATGGAIGTAIGGGSGAAAAGVGAVPGAGAGAFIGTSAGTGIASGVLTVYGLIKQLSSEIYGLPEQQLYNYAPYRALREQGIPDDKARAMLIDDGTKDIMGTAFAAGFGTGMISPETLLLKSGSLNSLLKGGFLPRLAKGVSMGAVSGALANLASQIPENKAYDAALQADRGLWYRAMRQGFEGGLIGGALGIGGAFRGEPEAATAPQPTPRSGAAQPADATQVADLNVPEQSNVQQVPGTEINPQYNPQQTALFEERVNAATRVSQLADNLYNKKGQYTAADFQPLFDAINYVEGLNPPEEVQGALQGILKTLQTRVNERGQSRDIKLDRLYAAAQQASIPQPAAPETVQAQPIIEQPVPEAPVPTEAVQPISETTTPPTVPQPEGAPSRFNAAELQEINTAFDTLIKLEAERSTYDPAAHSEQSLLASEWDAALGWKAASNILDKYGVTINDRELLDARVNGKVAEYLANVRDEFLQSTQVPASGKPSAQPGGGGSITKSQESELKAMLLQLHGAATNAEKTRRSRKADKQKLLKQYLGDEAHYANKIEKFLNDHGLPYSGLLQDIQEARAAKRVDAFIDQLKDTIQWHFQVEETKEPTVDLRTNASKPVQFSQMGADTTLTIPGYPAPEPATYEVVEANAVQTSHLPGQFERNRKYPFENERRYHDEPASQEKVRTQALQLDPNLVLRDSPTANDGAPIIDQDGNVLGGNGRMMAIKQAYENNTERIQNYKNALALRMQELGLDPNQLDGMQQPVLVRRLTKQYDMPTRQELISRMNDFLTQAREKQAEGRTRGVRFSQQSLQLLGNRLTEADSLREFFDKPESRELIARLKDDGVIRTEEDNRFINQDGMLTPEGKTVVIDALRGNIVRDYEQISRLPSNSADKLDALIPSILITESAGKGWGLRPYMQDLIDILSDYRKSAFFDSGDRTSFLATPDLISGVAPRDRYSPGVADLFNKFLTSKKDDIVKQFKAYAQAAQLYNGEQAALIAPLSPREAANKFLGIDINPEEYNAQIRTPDEGGATGLNQGSADGNSAAAANPAESSAIPLAGDTAQPSQDGGAVESGGAGGTAYESAGAPSQDVLNPEPMAGERTRGTDGRPDNLPAISYRESANYGERGIVGAAEQRASDGRFADILGRIAQPGDTDSQAINLAEYALRRDQYYRDQGYTPEEAQVQANADTATARTIAEYFAETNPAPVETAEILKPLDLVAERLSKLSGFTQGTARDNAGMYYRIERAFNTIKDTVVFRESENITHNVNEARQTALLAAEPLREFASLLNLYEQLNPGKDTRAIRASQHYAQAVVQKCLRSLKKIDDFVERLNNRPTLENALGRGQAELNENLQILRECENVMRLLRQTSDAFDRIPDILNGLRNLPEQEISSDKAVLQSALPTPTQPHGFLQKTYDAISGMMKQLLSAFKRYLRTAKDWVWHPKQEAMRKSMETMETELLGIQEDFIQQELLHGARTPEARRQVETFFATVQTGDLFTETALAAATPETTVGELGQLYRRAVNDIATAYPDVGLDVDLQARLDGQASRLYLNYVEQGVSPETAYQLSMRNTRMILENMLQPRDAQVYNHTAQERQVAGLPIGEVQTELSMTPERVEGHAADEVITQTDTESVIPLGWLSEDEAQQLTWGQLDPAVEVEAQASTPSPLDLNESGVSTNPTSVNPDSLLSEEAYAGQQQQLAGDIAAALESAGVYPAETVATASETPAQPVFNEAETQALNQAATLLRTINQENRAAAAQGAELANQQQEAFAKINYASKWQPGWWARQVTKARDQFVSADAWPRLWMLQFFSNMDENPDHTPIIQAFSNVRPRISGAWQLTQDNVLRPLQTWGEATAKQYNTDYEVFMRDMGNYRTMLHTIEGAQKQHQLLLQDVQNAMLLPPGAEKNKTVNAAETALDKYTRRQAGEDVKCKLYGGRSIQEAQTILSDLLQKYGRDTLEEGNARIGEAINWITRFGAANGVISEKDIAGYDNWLYYTPLTTIQEATTGNGLDITYFSPRQNFHREGSTDPAQDSYNALVQYAQRMARSVGMTDFATQLRCAYLSLEKMGEVSSTRGSELNFYSGMAMVEAQKIHAIKENSGNDHMKAWAEGIQNDAAMTISVLGRGEDGQTATKRYYVLFDDPKVNEGFRRPFNSSPEHPFFSTAAKVTGTYAGIYTRFKMMFAPINHLRDTAERSSLLPTKNYTSLDGKNVEGMKIAAQMGAFMANPKNFLDVLTWYTTGECSNPELNTILQDYKYSGLDESTNYLRSMQRQKTINQLTEATNAAIDAAKKKGLTGEALKKARNALKTVDAWNSFWYALPGMNQFIQMRRNNIGVRESVYGVSELMNTAHRGKMHGVLSAFYPFVNSIGQSSANMLGALGLHSTMFSNHPTAKMQWKKALRGWATGFAFYYAIRALIPNMRSSLVNKEDDTGELTMDNLPLSKISSGVVVGIGDGDYISVPNGFGIPMIFSMLAYGADRVERGKMHIADLGMELTTAIGKSLVPNSAPAFAFRDDPMSYIIQTFSPMLAQPVIQAVTGRTYSGKKLPTEPYDATRRASDAYNLSTPAVYRIQAQNIYETTGIDMSPEAIRTITNGYLGGALRALVTWIEGDPLYSDPEHQSTREILGPFWTFVGATSLYQRAGNVSRNAYYRAKSYYENLIKDMGIGAQLKGDKYKVLLAAGLSPSEASDYMQILEADKKLTDYKKDLRGKLDAIGVKNMESETVKPLFLEWIRKMEETQKETVASMNYFKTGFIQRSEVPDPAAARAMRRENPTIPVERGNMNLGDLPTQVDESGNRMPLSAGVQKDRGGLYVVFPLFTPEGEEVSVVEGWDAYLKSGMHLGKYQTNSAAQNAAQQFYSEQASI